MELVKIINDAILNQCEDEHRKYIGASQIGRPCGRETWYRYHGIAGTPISAKLRTTFEIGHRLESMLLDYIEMSGIDVERPSESNNYLFCQDPEILVFQGHMDAILNKDYVLDIKTAKNSSFNQFTEHGLKKWSPAYYSQMQSYMGMTGLHEAVLLAINKDTSQMHEEWVEYDDYEYSQLRMRALAISSLDEPPARINVNPIYYVCRMCQFKTICHRGD